MKNSMLQSINTSSCSLDLSSIPKSRSRSSTEGGGFVCGDCGRTYKLKSSLRNHQKWECGKEPQFKCPYCSYKAKQKMHMARHLERMHREIDISAVKSEPLEDDSKEGPCSTVKPRTKTALITKECPSSVKNVEEEQSSESIAQDLSSSQD